MGSRTVPQTGHRDRSSRSGRVSRDVIAAVRPIAEHIVAIHGLVLWDVRFVREAGRETLQIAVDRVGGVSADELAGVSEDLSRELDHGNVVPGNARYVLEVTSPGAERKLHGAEQFAVCYGREARVTLSDGRVVEGKIGDLSENVVEMETAEGRVRVFLDDVRSARLVIKI
jgi:ribosome maturation factor RimP